MEEVRITDIPYLEVVTKLQAAGYEYIKTPISWRRTADYVRDLPESIQNSPVVALSSAYQEVVGIWPWIDDGAVVTNPPLAVMRVGEPPEGLGIHTHRYLKFSEFGSHSDFVCCRVYQTAGTDQDPILTVWEPTARTAAAIVPDEWSAETEEEFGDLVRDMCYLWIDGDFAIVWSPGTDNECTETVVKTPPKH